MHKIIVIVVLVLCHFTAVVRAQEAEDPVDEQLSLQSVTRYFRYNNGRIFPRGGAGGLSISFTGVGGGWPGASIVAPPDSIPLPGIFSKFESEVRFPDYHQEWFHPVGETVFLKMISDAWSRNLWASARSEYSKQADGFQMARLEHVRTWAVARTPRDYPRTSFLMVRRTVTVDNAAPETRESFMGVTIPADDILSSPVDFKPGALTRLVNNVVLPIPFASGYKEEIHLSLVPMEVAVDADRDGKITFDGKDKTTAEEPFRFWINDDVDKGNTVDATDYEEDDLNESVKDSDDGKVNFRRDLEDLTSLWIDFSGIGSVFPASDPTVELKVRIEANAGTPMVNLFQPVETDGGREYLKDENTGYNQLQGIYGQELCKAASTAVVVPRRAWETLPSDKVIHLLFEGAKEGDGKLIFEIWKDGAKMCDLPPVHLRLKKARDMYETWTVGDVAAGGVDFSAWPAGSATQTSGQDLPSPEKPEEKDYIMFVHGWNMPPWEKEIFASTMFKRMWHQGYKGRFGAFRWPTFHELALDAENWTNTHSAHFDGSEQRAWNSAAPLATLATSLSGTFKDSSGKSLVRLYAHSMGNVVAAESLRQMASAPKVHTYISAQAALSSHVWDNTTPEMAYFTPTTANVYGYYWQTGAITEPHVWAAEGSPSYMNASYMPASTVVINHYNPLDWALSYWKWQINQSLKPDTFYYYSRPPLDLVNIKQRFWTDRGGAHGVPTVEFAFPNDRFEVFSYAAESRAYATGQQGATAGKFKIVDSVNLNDPSFDFGSAHKGHSAQFRSTIQKRWTYWTKAIEDMAITPASP